MQSTAARADRAIPQSPGARVDREFIGLAREFRRRIAEAEVGHAEVVEQWINPLRPKAGVVKMPRHKYLKSLADNWSKLPNYGQLALSHEFTKGRLHVVEIRCSATVISNLPDWQTEGSEPGIWLAMYSLTIQPPSFGESVLPISLLGLHALSRRYQRGTTRDHLSVVKDLVPIARYFRNMSDELVAKAVAAQTPRDHARMGDFEIPTTDGKWLGSLMLADGQLVLAIRTYINV